MSINETSINKQHQNIIDLLRQKRLKEALRQTETLITQGNVNPALTNRLEQDKTSYEYMLQYMRQGMEDPQRKGMYQQLCAGAWNLADLIRINLLDKDSTHYYHELRRTQTYRPSEISIKETLHLLEGISDDIALFRLTANGKPLPSELLQKHDNNCRDIFLETWTNSRWSKEEENEANLWLESISLPSIDLCIMTSAVTLSLLECFDEAKLLWLLQATRHNETAPAQRALVGLALALLTYGKRLELYPKITQALTLHNEEYGLGIQLNRIIIQLLRAQDTEKINRKMQQEILPEMMKNADLLRQMRLGTEETEEEDANPDWAETFDRMGLTEKIQEMNELQMEGSDIYMSSFAMLKNYPFFHDLVNWFVPFYQEHSSIAPLLTGTNPLSRPLLFLLESGFFCNSDKYSLAFMLQYLPQAQRDQMVTQLTNADIDRLEEENHVSQLQKHAARPEVISNQYVHDLYRFFKLNRRRTEFRDPFAETIHPYECEILRTLLGEDKQMRQVADFLFQKERRTEALPIYQELTTRIPDDAELFQKVGFCLQKEKRYDEAINAYRMADVLKPDHVWTIRHLATCYRLSHQYDKALEYYLHIEQIQPGNATVLYYAGACLAALSRYEEALQYFFRLDLQEENCIRAWRSIAWCSLLSGRWPQAAKYYGRIPEEERNADDDLNAGHTSWVSGDLPAAVEHYRKAAARYGSHVLFRQAFDRDRIVLVGLGIDAEDIPLMEDQVF